MANTSPADCPENHFAREEFVMRDQIAQSQAALEAALIAMEVQVAELKATKEEMPDERLESKQLKEQLESKQVKFKDLMNYMKSALRTTAVNTDRVEAGQRLQSKMADVKYASMHCEQLQTENQQLQHQLANSRLEAKQLRMQLEYEQRKYKQLESSRKAMRKENLDLRCKLGSARLKASQLQSQNQQLQYRLGNERLEAEQLRKQLLFGQKKTKDVANTSSADCERNPSARDELTVHNLGERQFNDVESDEDEETPYEPFLERMKRQRRELRDRINEKYRQRPSVEALKRRGVLEADAYAEATLRQ